MSAAFVSIYGLTLILSAVLTAVEAMDSALSIWLWMGRPGLGAWEDSPSTDLLLRVWSLKVRGREPKLDTLGMLSLGSTVIG